MILLVLLASVLIITVTIYQYEEQTEDYNVSRFGRKEETLHKEIEIQLNQRTTFAVNTKNLPNIFQKSIYEIAFIHNLEITMYDLEGKLLKTSIPFGLKDVAPKNLSPQKVAELEAATKGRVFEIIEDDFRLIGLP
jgi:hypothetical protein